MLDALAISHEEGILCKLHQCILIVFFSPLVGNLGTIFSPLVGNIGTMICLGPHGDGLLVAGLFFTDYPPSWKKIPPVEDPGLCDPPGEPGWLSW